MMTKDIESRQDIEILINSFYDKVKIDEVIGHIFTTIIGSDWTHHLPVMYSFWETILLAKAGYMGNPIKTHIDIDKKIPLKKDHFERWLMIWNETVTELFNGKNADEAKNRAMLMANLITMKVEMAKDSNFIG